jgi:DNA-binding MarR family transcriptional regulator
MAEKLRYTAKQSQSLTFIHDYTKMHRRAPAEADLQRYFGVSGAAVHQLLRTLEAKGIIERIRGKARAIGVLLPREGLPDLE